MLQRKTTLVIGAGASAEFNLPVGNGLRERIIGAATPNTNGLEWDSEDARPKLDQGVKDALTQKTAPADPQVMRAALQIISANLYMKNSIDVFLDHNQKIEGLVQVGKMLIALCIGRAEQDSSIYKAMDWNREILDLRKLNATWIEAFARILLDVSTPKEIGEKVSIICFNYDRCIEFYLIAAIRQTFSGMSYAEAHDIVYGLNIIHPYGTLGKLPRGLAGYGNGAVPFGPDFQENDLWEMTKELKIFTEREHDTETLRKMRHAIAFSDNLIFMGFGFAQQNMELLDTHSLTDKAPRKRVYVTGKGISAFEEEEVQRRLSRLFAPSTGLSIGLPREPAIIMRDATCSQLFASNYLNFSS